jgi:hypothetical protein
MKNMTLEKEKNYYLRKKRVLMRTFDAAISIVKSVLIKYFGDDIFNEILLETRSDFEELLPQIPYVGGNNNPLTEDLVNSAILIPFLRFFEKQRLTFDEIGRITYELFEKFNSFIPPKEDIFTEKFLTKEKENAKKSKLTKYSGDWVFDFVEGDGSKFTFGINYLECGVYKFYKSQDLEHFMPIICVSDFAKAQTHGYGFSRTQTIGNGAPLCDFRYKKGGKTPRGWPLENLPEYKKK